MNAATKSWQERMWRRQGLNRLGLRIEEYDRYLESPHWQTFRKAALAKQAREHDSNFCHQCSSTEALHVHHVTYERLGAERLDDVSIICGENPRPENGGRERRGLLSAGRRECRRRFPLRIRRIKQWDARSRGRLRHRITRAVAR